MARVISNYQKSFHGFHIRRIPDKSRKGLKLIFPFFFQLRKWVVPTCILLLCNGFSQTSTATSKILPSLGQIVRLDCFGTTHR